MMSAIPTIVAYGLREALRRKVFAVVLLLTAGFLFLYWLPHTPPIPHPPRTQHHPPSAPRVVPRVQDPPAPRRDRPAPLRGCVHLRARDVRDALPRRRARGVPHA